MYFITTFISGIVKRLIETHPRLSSDHHMMNEIYTFSNGCLGSHNDEERSEMRYVMRIAKSSESSKF